MPERSGHALIVGASSGIGKALAERLALRMSVTVMARRLDRLRELEPLGVSPVQCDVSDSASISPAVEASVAERGKISSLVYCAGVQKIKPIRILKPGEIRDLLAVNLEAPLVFAGLFTSKRMTTE